MVGNVSVEIGAKVDQSLKSSLNAVRKEVKASVGDINSTLSTLGLGLSAGMLVREALQATDAYTKMTAQLMQSTESYQEFATAQEDVRRISMGAQADITTITALYGRLSLAMQDAGTSQQEIADISETVALSLKVSGASTAEASGAMLQLSQAFGAGRLAGEEFNAMSESAPNLLRALAKSMDVPYGSLKALAAEGVITSEVLAEAFTDPALLDALRNQAEEMRTISGAWQEMKNELTLFVGEGANASGAVNLISGAIGGLADGIQYLDEALLAVGTVIVGRTVPAFVLQQVAAIRTQAALAGVAGSSLAAATAQGVLATAVRGLNGALLLIGGPVGGVIAMATAAAYLLVQGQRELAEESWAVATAFDEILAKLGSMNEIALQDQIKLQQKTIDGTMGQIAAYERLKGTGMDTTEALRKTNDVLRVQEEQMALLVRQLGGLQDGTRVLSGENKAAAAYVYALDHGFEQLGDSTLSAMRYLAMMRQGTTELTAEQKKAIAETEKAIGKNDEFLEGLRAEIAELRLEGRELAINTELRRLNANATSEQIAEAERLAGVKFEMMEADRHLIELEALVQEGIDDRFRSEKDAAEKIAAERKKQDAEMLASQAQLWNRVDDAGLRAFTSIADGGRDAMERLEDSIKSGVYALLYEMTLKKWVINIATNVSGGAVAQQAFGSAAGGMLGSVAGGGGIMAAGSQFLGGLTNGAIGTNSMIATGASSAGAGISAAIGAIPVWGWAVMAAAVAAKLLAKEETPSFNAGLLLEALPGVGGQFDTARFDSGLDVSGYSRRSSQSDAEKVIELFRGIDSTFTELSKQAGYDVNLNRGNFTGLDERGLGSGLFLGTAGESGDAVTNLQQQMDGFALQWITAMKDQLKSEDFEAIVGAGGAEAMATKYKEIVDAQTAALKEAEQDQAGILTERLRLQDQLDELTMSATELQDKYRNALDESNRALFDQIEAAKEEKSIAAERTSLQEQLNQLTRTSTDLWLQQRSALDASNRALFDEITALTAAKERRESLVESTRQDFDTAMSAVSTAMSGVSRAVKAERDLITQAYNDSTEAVTEGLARLTGLSNALKSTLESLSGVSRPQAQAQVIAALAAARAGAGLPTAEQLNPALNALREPSEGLFATFEDYQRDFMRTANDIEDLAKITDSQKAAVESQLDVMKASFTAEMARLDSVLAYAQAELDALNGIDNSIKSLGVALGGFRTAVDGAQSAQAAASAAVAAQTATTTPAYTAYSAEDIRAYASMLGINSTQDLFAAALAKNADPLAVGAAYEFTEAETITKLRAAGIPGYASGGDFLGGLRIVGERGPELEATGPSRIFNADQTRRIMGGSGTSEMVDELRRTNRELAAVKLELVSIRVTNQRISDIAEKADTIGPLPARAEA